MQLTAWTFSKKHNSTAQPTGAGTVYTVALKEDCSVDNPVFILGTGITATINYCQALGHYYFIDNIVILTKDQVELHCSMDVLATYKTEIGNYTAFVERAASANNPYIVDDAITQTQHVVMERSASTEIFTVSDYGCYIVRVVGAGASRTGISSWVLDASDLSSLLSFMFDDNNFNQELQDAVVKTFFNPFQYIVSLMWFPMNKSDIGGETAQLTLGWWPVGSFKKLTSMFYYGTTPVTVPDRLYTTDFRGYHPSYTEVTAIIPGIGVVQLDPLILDGNGDTLTALTAVDWITGAIRLEFQQRGTIGPITDALKFSAASFTGQLGVPIPVAQIAGQSESLAAGNYGIAGKVAGAALDIVGNISGALKGVSNVTAPTPSIIGNSGNLAAIYAQKRLVITIRNFGVGNMPTDVYGRPLCENRVINTLSGFVKCQAASIALAAPLEEINAVNDFLNAGFYYE